MVCDFCWKCECVNITLFICSCNPCNNCYLCAKIATNVMSMAEEKEKKAYSVSEASKLLGVTGATIRKHINEGKMQAIQYFGKWVIPRSEIERYQAQLKAIGIDVTELD